MTISQFEDFIAKYDLFKYDMSIPGSENILKNAYAAVLKQSYLKKGEPDPEFKKILKMGYD